jgi:hypothetical protein
MEFRRLRRAIAKTGQTSEGMGKASVPPESELITRIAIVGTTVVTG